MVVGVKMFDLQVACRKQVWYTVECFYFFCTWHTTSVHGCAPGVRQARHRWLSVIQLDVLKLACKVVEWVFAIF